MFAQIKLFINQFKIYFIGAIALLIFLAGVGVTRMYYQNILKDQQVKLEQAKNELKTALENVRVEYVTKIEYIKVKGEDRVRTVTQLVPADFVSNGFVEFHNAAVQNRDAVVNEHSLELSTKTMQDVANVVNENYTSCNKYIEQVNALQQSLEAYNKIYGTKK